MELKNLMSGIAVVIDDRLENGATDYDLDDDNTDLIVKIVKQLEDKWNLPFYAMKRMPPEKTWPNLLQAASFILLDWRWWPMGASALEQENIKTNIRFLKRAKDYFLPVFVFTNEDPEDVRSELPESIYHEDSPGKNFVFIQRKAELLSDDSLDFSSIKNWISQNASVYALKVWEQVFHVAKKELFSSMYARSPDWPKVFWKAYKDDGVDPSSSLTHLINDSLRGRMQTNTFEGEILGALPAEVPRKDLQALITETSVRPLATLPDDEIRCGDLFLQPKRKYLLNLRPDCDCEDTKAAQEESDETKYLLNLRPDCDCVPRDGKKPDEVELFCVEGKRMSDSDLGKKYHMGHFDERVWECIAFSVHQEKSVRFDFRKLQVRKFSELRSQRIGRLLHPYLTRIQQRFALYQQRQALPRIPAEAVPSKPNRACTS